MSTGLPEHWEVRTSSSKGLPYFFKTDTKESSWEPPKGTDTELLKIYMGMYHTSSDYAIPDHAIPNTASLDPAMFEPEAYGLVDQSSAAQSKPQPGDSGAAMYQLASPNTDGKIKCSHLLVKHKDSRRPASWRESNITRTKEEALNRIRAFLASIRSGATTLGDLATTESDCSSARKRGDLGYFGKGDMQKEFEDAAFALRPGSDPLATPDCLSDIVESASGLHIIQRFE